ncbi:hypothetical protein LIA77_04233 [Sarocladium implicatum]|nr:hypothetical protein LIA77_04233 [Sarocladium implicatum]
MGSAPARKRTNRSRTRILRNKYGLKDRMVAWSVGWNYPFWDPVQAHEGLYGIISASDLILQERTSAYEEVEFSPSRSSIRHKVCQTTRSPCRTHRLANPDPAQCQPAWHVGRLDGGPKPLSNRVSSRGQPGPALEGGTQPLPAAIERLIVLVRDMPVAFPCFATPSADTDTDTDTGTTRPTLIDSGLFSSLKLSTAD